MKRSFLTQCFGGGLHSWRIWTDGRTNDRSSRQHAVFQAAVAKEKYDNSQQTTQPDNKTVNRKQPSRPTANVQHAAACTRNSRKTLFQRRSKHLLHVHSCTVLWSLSSAYKRAVGLLFWRHQTHVSRTPNPELIHVYTIGLGGLCATALKRALNLTKKIRKCA